MHRMHVRSTAMWLLGTFLGRRRLQPAFAALHRLALLGMNMGARADDPRTSGEAIVLRELHAGATVFDVGANVGVYSELVLGLVVSPRLFAFEPDRVAATEYRRRIGGSAHLVEAGLGAIDGEVPFFTSDAGSSLASTVHRHHTGVSWAPSGMIAIGRLDSVAESLSVEHIDLLKVDVEGGELAVLRGAERMLAEGRIDRVQFEFGGTAVDARIFLRDIVEKLDGFDLYRIVRDGLVPVVYDERWEIFTTTNYLAVRIQAPAQKPR